MLRVFNEYFEYIHTPPLRCVCVRRISLDGEGNALYPVLSSFQVLSGQYADSDFDCVFYFTLIGFFVYFNLCLSQCVSRSLCLISIQQLYCHILSNELD